MDEPGSPEQRARTDDLTGLANRRGAEARLVRGYSVMSADGALAITVYDDGSTA